MAITIIEGITAILVSAGGGGGGGGSGTVTSVSVTTVSGVGGTVANATTTPAISISLGAIKPDSVAANSFISAVSGNFQNISGFVISKEVYIEAPSNKTYPIDNKAAFPYTINQTLAIQCSGGTVTGTINVNASAVTGLASIAIDSSAKDRTATGNNIVNTGDNVTLVLASNASAADIQFTLSATR